MTDYLDELISVIARLVREAGFFNTLNEHTVEVIFQKSPGEPDGDPRGIQNMEYRLERGGRLIRQDRTPADGRIQVPVRAGVPTELRLLHNGALMAIYQVTRQAGALASETARLGQKQRLRQLGYQIEHAGADGDGVDGTNNEAFERSTLDFQADESLLDDADFTDNTDQNRLRAEAGA